MKPRKFKQYKAKKHEHGGQLVNNLGVPDLNNPVAEIEGSENSYQFQNLSSDNYVFSEENNTAALTKAIIKKYSKGKNADLDEPTKNALEMELTVAKKINELIKNSKQAPNSQIMNTGGAIDPLVNPTPITSLQVQSLTQPVAPLPNPISVEPPNKINLGEFASNNLGSTLSTVSQLANVSQLFNKPEVDTPIQPDYRQADAQQAKLSANLDQSRQDAVSSRNLVSNLNRNSSGSYSTYRSREAQNIGNLQDNLANIQLQERQLQNNIAQSRTGYETNKALTNAQLERQSREINDQNEAANRNIKRSVVSDVAAEGSRQQTIQNNQEYIQDVIANKKELTEAQIANNKALAQASVEETRLILNSLYPNFNIDEEFQDALRQLASGEISEQEFNIIKQKKQPLNFEE